jgi:hypothetical protein
MAKLPNKRIVRQIPNGMTEVLKIVNFDILCPKCSLVKSASYMSWTFFDKSDLRFTDVKSSKYGKARNH